MKRLQKQLGLIGVDVDEKVCATLYLFLEEMLRWNRKVNLTAISDPQEALEKHIIDSLLLNPFVADGETLLDMGSGAGLPGIPLQIVRPGLRVVSVDSVGKKINFQKHIKRMLKLENFTPLNVRLEGLEAALGRQVLFNKITARAFASLDMIIQLASKWLAPGGQILAMKGPEGEAELEKVKKEVGAAGLSIEAIQKFRLPISGAERQIIILIKK